MIIAQNPNCIIIYLTSIGISRCLSLKPGKVYEMEEIKNIYKGASTLPSGKFKGELTNGCLILEGGAFRGVYTSGVTDRLLQAGIKFNTVIGVSAGALNGACYSSGVIGLAGRVNLFHRHDRHYVGRTPLRTDKGVIGFSYLFGELLIELGFDYDTFYDPSHSYYAEATNCLTGSPEYFDKGSGVIFEAIRASASMPVVSKMVDINGTPYLDGGCSQRIPLDFALERGFEKIIVVCTKPRGFRRKETESLDPLRSRLYKAYPEFRRALTESSRVYNLTCDRLEALEKEGRLIVIAPSKDLGIKRLEGDMDKLGRLYYLGYSDTDKILPALYEYLR